MMENEGDKSRKTETEKRKARVHRVGTITFGLVLVLFGCLFLMRLFLPQIDYQFIFRLWPCTLICLGIEVLMASADKEAVFTYDKTAVMLMVILVIFAMGMAGMDFIMEHAAEQSSHQIYIW